MLCQAAMNLPVESTATDGRPWSLGRVAIAVRHALRWTAPTADAIKQLLIPSQRPELKTFHLAGREHLCGVTVAATDLGAYGRLREVAHV